LIPAEPDLPRMRRERHRRLVSEMQGQGFDALILLGGSNVSYATGARVMGSDFGRAAYHRPVAVVLATDEEGPHLFTPFPEGAPPDLPDDHVHGHVPVDSPGRVELAARRIADVLGEASRGSIGIDEYSLPLRASLERVMPGATLGDPNMVMSAARVVKSADELSCIKMAQRINEVAIADLWSRMAPGTRTAELTGLFLERVFELGITGNVVDPVWQVMPRSISEGPYSVTGDVVFPTPASDEVLDTGDVVWVDTGLTFHGYGSDFGCTAVIGNGGSAAQQRQFQEWRAIVDRVLERVRPGATGGELTRAAVGERGSRPWLRYFYLAHGIGADPAEMPFIGTDLGPDFDESLVLAPGMVLVLEPVVWDEGESGYRAEEIVAVTDSGYERLSTPFTGVGPP
jgi:Xaa-Pro dipeptidase